MAITNKTEKINIPSIQIDKNVITYGNAFLCTDNISLITISPIPANISWIFAIILGIISFFFIKMSFLGVIMLLVAITWLIIVIYQNSTRGENLAINLNSGVTLYFNCRDRNFLNQVIFTMVESIKNKNEAVYSINFDKCTIYGGVFKESVIIGK